MTNLAAPAYTSVNTVTAYNTKKRSWSILAPLPTVLDHAGGAVVGGTFYVVGGRINGSFADNVNSVYALNIKHKTPSWTRKAIFRLRDQALQSQLLEARSTLLVGKVTERTQRPTCLTMLRFMIRRLILGPSCLPGHCLGESPFCIRSVTLKNANREKGMALVLRSSAARSISLVVELLLVLNRLRISMCSRHSVRSCMQCEQVGQNEVLQG